MTSAPVVALSAGASLELAVVLVVDDEAAIRAWLSRALIPHVKAVHTAASVGDGHRLAASLPHLDLLITDVVLPDARLRLADLVRVRHPHVRVLTISGYGCDQIGGPAVSFLPKPFSLEELLRCARHVLDIPEP